MRIEGYYWGTITVRSIEDEEFKIWFKNENHVCWKTDSLMSPARFDLHR
ncbi:MAG: hypothetical protein ACLVJO_14695 [[Clostridium] scindens]